MVYSVEIRNQSGTKKFRFFEAEVPSFRFGMSVKRFKYEEIDGDGTGNLSLNLGTEKTVAFPFKLLLTTDDAAVGTHTSTVKTIAEKVDYLIGVKASDGVTFIKNPFLETGVDDFYFVDIYSHTGTFLNNLVQLDNISFEPNSNNPNSLTGSIAFTIGGGKQ